MRYEEANALLVRLGGNEGWVGHCRAVSAVAEALGRALNVEHPGFLRRAALLHDIGRCRTHDPVLHGVEGFHLLSGLGFAREARVCVSHLLYALTPGRARDLDIDLDNPMPQSLEEQLIPVADFLVEGDQPTTLDARFASLRRRYRGDRDFVERFSRSEAWVRSRVAAFANRWEVPPETYARRALAGA